MSRAIPDHPFIIRLAKEWEAQQRNNNAQNAMVFAQPRFPDSPQDLREWVGVILGPEGSVYQGGAFQVSMSFGNEYPMKPPSVKFVTQIFHPNVWGEPDDRQGEICLDILKENWSPANRVHAVLLSIVALLEEPNGNSALWPFAGEMYQKDRAMFDRYARQWVKTHAFPMYEQLLVGHCHLKPDLAHIGTQMYEQLLVGNCHLKPDLALPLYDQARATLEAAGDHAGVGRVCEGLGKYHSKMREYDRALPLYEQARAAFEAAGDRAGVGRSCEGIGDCHLNMGQPTRALPLYKKARAAFEAADDSAGVGRACEGIGNCHLNMGR